MTLKELVQYLINSYDPPGNTHTTVSTTVTIEAAVIIVLW